MFGATFEPGGGAGGITKIKIMDGWNILGATVPASSTRTLTPLVSGLQTSQVSTFVSMPVTIKNLYFRFGTQPATGSMVVTLYKNGVATNLSITILAGATSGVASNTTNSVSLAAGDAFRIDVVNNATSASGTIGSVTYEEDF